MFLKYKVSLSLLVKQILSFECIFLFNTACVRVCVRVDVHCSSSG